MVRPLKDNILLKRIEEPSNGTIHIPEIAKNKEKSQKGIALAIGSGVTADIKAGDRVLFSKYSGTDIQTGSEKYVIISEQNIYAVIE